MNNDINGRTETPDRTPPPPRSSILWILLLPLILLVGAMWQDWRTPDRPSTPPQVDNGGDTIVPTPPPVATPRPKPTPRPTPSTNGTPVKLTLFVPNENGELQQSVVTDPALLNTELPTAPSTHFSVVAATALRLLLKKAPENFPTGTKLLAAPKLEDDVVRLNLSKEFQQPEFWQGSAQTQMTVYSIVNTVAAVESGDTKPVKVQLLVEGKPLDVLGEFDVSEPMEPDMTLVAKS
jgi:hypothetical protein